MKKLWITVLMATSALALQAADYAYLRFQLIDGTETTLDVTNLQLIVSDGQLVATNAAGTLRLPLEQLATMSFTHQPTAIATAQNSTPTTGEREIYNMAGVLVFKGSGVATLPTGVYLVALRAPLF